MGPDEIIAIVFFGCVTAVTITSLIIINIRKAFEAKHKGGANNDEVNALRHEVAHLHDKMNDVLLQLEYNKGQQPADLTERITPPEFNKQG